jgi:hypothetical protein
MLYHCVSAHYTSPQPGARHDVFSVCVEPVAQKYNRRYHGSLSRRRLSPEHDTPEHQYRTVSVRLWMDEVGTVTRVAVSRIKYRDSCAPPPIALRNLRELSHDFKEVDPDSHMRAKTDAALADAEAEFGCPGGVVEVCHFTSLAGVRECITEFDQGCNVEFRIPDFVWSAIDVAIDLDRLCDSESSPRESVCSHSVAAKCMRLLLRALRARALPGV